MLMYAPVHCAFSVLFALSLAHLRLFQQPVSEWLKKPQEAGYGVEKHLKMLMVVPVHCAFSVLFALSSLFSRRVQQPVGDHGRSLLLCGVNAVETTIAGRGFGRCSPPDRASAVWSERQIVEADFLLTPADNIPTEFPRLPLSLPDSRANVTRSIDERGE